MSGGESGLEARASSRVAAPFVKSDHGMPVFKPHQAFCHLYEDPSLLSVARKCLYHSGCWLL